MHLPLPAPSPAAHSLPSAAKQCYVGHDFKLGLPLRMPHQNSAISHHPHLQPSPKSHCLACGFRGLLWAPWLHLSSPIVLPRYQGTSFPGSDLPAAEGQAVSETGSLQCPQTCPRLSGCFLQGLLPTRPGLPSVRPSPVCSVEQSGMLPRWPLAQPVCMPGSSLHPES